jgi:hypothetical protein
MAWIIASIPFWIAGFFLFPLAASAAILIREPEETASEQGQQFFACLVVGGILLFVAAWMCS